jgi:hypothetical protein
LADNESIPSTTQTVNVTGVVIKNSGRLNVVVLEVEKTPPIFELQRYLTAVVSVQEPVTATKVLSSSEQTAAGILS